MADYSHIGFQGDLVFLHTHEITLFLTLFPCFFFFFFFLEGVKGEGVIYYVEKVIFLCILSDVDFRKKNSKCRELDGREHCLLAKAGNTVIDESLEME